MAEKRVVESWWVTPEGLTLYRDREFAARVPIEQFDELVFQLVKMRRELNMADTLEKMSRK